MKSITTTISVLATLLLIAGCSSDNDEGAARENFLDDQMQAIDKAKEVEDVLKKGLDKRMQSVNE